jgi:hypothetical protein
MAKKGKGRKAVADNIRRLRVESRKAKRTPAPATRKPVSSGGY